MLKHTMGRLREWSLWSGGLVMVVFMCGETHYGEVEGAVSLERWSCNTHYGEVQGVVSLER